MKYITNNKVLVSAAISLIFLWLAVRGVDWVAVGENMQRFDKGLLFVGAVIWLMAYLLRGLRWQILLKPLTNVSWWDSFRVLMVGFALNNTLPLRAGEFGRAYLLNKVNSKVSASAAFATVAGERVFDGLAVVTYTIIGGLALSLPTWALKAIWLSLVLFVGAFVVFLVGIQNVENTHRLIKWFTKWLPGKWRSKIQQLTEHFISGLSSLTSFKSVVMVLLFSFLIWGAEVVFYYLSAVSFGIGISFVQAAFLMGILNLGIMVPSAPGGIGTFEFITVISLALLGVSESLAFGYGVVSHVVQNGLVIIIGYFFLAQSGMRLGSVVKNSAVEELSED